jgi:ech hydrogenase subunit A
MYLFILLALLLPAVCAPLMLLIKHSGVRKVVVTTFSVAMIANAVMIAINVLGSSSHSIRIPSGAAPWAQIVVTIIDVCALIAILYYGFRLHDWKVIVPSLLQAGILVYLEVFKRPEEPQLLINIDNLGLVMLLIASILGSIIAVFALGYMEKHEAHKGLKKTKQHLFFAAIFLFLFAMNGICITDNIMHLYAFWEITTLCSFLLIGHDGNRSSIVSAKKALWINSLGGLFFAAGIVFIVNTANTLSIFELIKMNPGVMLSAGIMLICCAGFVKSAQLPFQPWLLGAMVAPTPVSALLHSSTMVKAGVYVIVRFSPMFGGRLTGDMVALVGAFTFMSASALAIGQSNGKRVLAYSTIANLGLIIACAGLGGPVALSAAILLIIYHAVSKALLFLCMGTVEQEIGSRNIEDMFGIYTKMPFTTIIMALGMASMLLPPFGVLITKWAAIEAAVNFPMALIFIVLGSAFTIVFWVKWIGATLTVYNKKSKGMEKLPLSISGSLLIIALFVPILTAMLPILNNYIVNPAIKQLLNVSPQVEGVIGGILIHKGSVVSGGFDGVIALLIVMFVVFLLLFLLSAFNKPKIVAPYTGGEHTSNNNIGRYFVGPQDKVERVIMHNYYFKGIFGEKRLGLICSFISVLLILVMFGVS